jgi:hypothetical protein
VNQAELQAVSKMEIAKWALGSLAFLCLTLNTGFAATGRPYVREGQSAVTYSVNHTTAGAKKLGILPSSGVNRQNNKSLFA